MAKKESGMTIIRIGEDTVQFLRSEEKYEETLADIAEKLLTELRMLREEKATKISNQSPLIEAKALIA
jgi:phosphopantetheinyl transferase (holo-ACP synthase)